MFCLLTTWQTVRGLEPKGPMSYREVKREENNDDDDDDDDGAADDENEDMSGGGSAINTGDILTMDGKSKLVRQIQEEERSATKAGEKEGNTKEGIRFGRIDHAVATCKSKLPEANFLELQHSI